MARENEEIEKVDKGAGTVMVGGMDDLVPGGKGKADDGLEVEIEPVKPPAGTTTPPVDDERRRRASGRDEDEDTRLAYDTGEDDEGEERGLSRRQRRNRQRRTVVAGRDQVIDSLNARVEQLTTMINSMGQSQIGLTIHTIDQQIGAAQQALNLADAEMKKASAEGNLQRYDELRNYKDEARGQLWQLNNHKRQVQHDLQQTVRPRVEQRRPEGQQSVPLNQRAQDFTQTFMSRFPDFDPNGADEDSLIMKAVDDSVAAEGYRPDTPMYWRTLEKKLAARGIYPDDGGDGGGDEREERIERRPAVRPNAGRPPTAGVHRRGGGVTFRLDPMMRDYLDSEGILSAEGLTDEQKAKRSRLINDWREGTRRMTNGGG